MLTLVAPVLAHPLTEPGGLELPPVVVATAAVGVVLAAGRVGRSPGPPPPPERHQPDDDRLTAPQVATRVVSVALLFLAVAAGRLGRDDPLDNLATVLVIGFAWPVLVVASALLGDIWRWVNPWDSVARVLERLDLGAREDDEADAQDAADVRWAVPAAGAWVWYLHAFPTPLAPRSVGAALGIYTLATLAGCLAVGRRRWLERAELLTVLLDWVARWRRGRLPAWRPPRGADVVLGVLAGGLLFGMVRGSSLWGSLRIGPGVNRWALVGLVAFCVLGALLLRGLDRYAAMLGAPGAAVVAAVPAIAGVVVAVALARSRLLTSAQLLPIVGGDPFGRGWDLFGTAGWPVYPNPLGNFGLVLSQVLVLCVGGALGAVVGRQRTRSGDGPPTDGMRRAADADRPAVVAVCTLVVVGVVAISAL